MKLSSPVFSDAFFRARLRENARGFRLHHDLKIREAFENAGLPSPRSDDDLEQIYDHSESGDPTYYPIFWKQDNII